MSLRSRGHEAGRGILSYFTRHATAANLLLVVLLISGLAALPQMRSQFFPDVIADKVGILVVWEGAGADDVDEAIIQVIEPSILAVEGVAKVTSKARDGKATMSIEFEPDWDMARAGDEVQAAVDAIVTLPEDAEDPEVFRGAWSDSVTDVVISGPVSSDRLGSYADEFATRLFAKGVSRIVINGVAAPRTVIEVPAANIVAYDVSFAQIARAVAAEVDTAPAGDVDGANARVRTGVEKRSAEEIAGIVLKVRDDGSKLTVGDVARVRVEGADRLRSYYVGDNRAVSIRVNRSARGDAIKIQKQVEDVAAQMNATLPKGVGIELVRTRAEAISSRLNILINNGAMGLVLVLGLLFLFLNVRAAFWVAVGIPASMMAAIAIMYMGGLTINMISLFGLIITLGIVVDDAIVVGEHADHRFRTYGESPVVAAETAARRMALPVFSSTITTVIAFFGLTMIGGRFGALNASIPYVVIAVLVASLIECFLILPNHMAHSLRQQAKERWYDIPSKLVNRGFNWFRRVVFRPFIAGVIYLRYPVMALALALLAMSAALMVSGDVRWRFFNAPERGSVTGNFAMLPGATRADTDAQRRLMEKAALDLGKEYEDRYGRNPVQFVLTEVGGNAGRGMSGTDGKDADQLGSIMIELIDADLRPQLTSYQFAGALNRKFTHHPMTEAVSFRSWRSGPGGDALHVQFYDGDAETLKAAAEALKTAVARFPEVSGVEDNLAYDKDELILELTPQGQALGFVIEDLGRVLRHRLNGLEAATYPDGPRSAEIRVELPKSEQTADFLQRSMMRSPTGSYVPLADIVSVKSRTGFSVVRRENGIRFVSVTGEISEDDPAAADAITRALNDEIQPDISSRFGVQWRLSGLAEQEREFLTDAGIGMTLCLVGIYLVLAWVFSSWVRPVVVMAIIPFGFVGTIYGHLIWEVPLSIFSIVGLIGMAGIIVNDSIVLVTTVDEYASERGLIPSIVDGAADRLRPVILTTLTTVLGLAPLLYESSQQAQFLRPTVITLVYGLGFGMFLVLLVVPALLAIQADVSRQGAAFRKAVRTRRANGLRALMLVSGGVLLAWLGATMGHVAITGRLWAPLSGMIPQGNPMAVALALFAAGAFVVTLLAYVAGGLGMLRQARRS